MPYIDSVCQFVLQTGTPGRLSFSPTGNFNANDSNGAGIVYATGLEVSQVVMVEIPSMAIPQQAQLDGVQAIVRATGTSAIGLFSGASINGILGTQPITYNQGWLELDPPEWGSPTDPSTLGLTKYDLQLGGNTLDFVVSPDDTGPSDEVQVDCIIVRAYYSLPSDGWRSRNFRSRPF